MTLSALRFAARRLRRARGFTLAAVLTLALGIAGTAAVFAVVTGVLLQPLPYREPAQLVDLSHTLAISGLMHVDQSDATYLYYRRANRTLADIGAYQAMAVNLVSDGATSQRVAAASATPSTFHVLGAAPLRGRGLTARDGEPGAPLVAVIGEGLWRRAFGGDASVIGRVMTVDGRNHQVVGVMPETFRFPTEQTALWIPLQLDPNRTRSAAFDYRGIGRLRPGVSAAAATVDLRRLLPEVPEAFPGRLSAGAIAATHMDVLVRPLRDVIVGDVGRALWIVFGAVGALLLIACSNVANLFLARAEGRQREIAVRHALGAGRGALLADAAAEAIIIAGVAGALGLALAALGLQLLQTNRAAAAIPRFGEVHVDVAVVAMVVVATLLAAAMVALVPALRIASARASLSATLAATSASALGGRTRHRARRALVMAQIALALVLVTGAGLFARSFDRLNRVDVGFVADRALAFRLSFPAATYPGATDAARVAVRTLESLGSIPGVVAAGAVTKLPFDEEARQDSAVFLEDHPLQPKEMPGIHSMEFATPGYFKAMGIPLLAGRLFAPPEPGRDVALLPREVVVSEALAKHYWPGAQAVGRRVKMNAGDPWSTIVGVVGSVRDAGLDQPPTEAVYMPLVTASAAGTPFAPRDLAFVARTTSDPASLTAAVRSAVERAAPTIPVYRMIELEGLRSQAAARTTFTLLLLGIAAFIALAIGAMGIYGVIAYLVSLRTRELGVRLALGAQPSDVRRLVVRHVMTDAVAGTALGIVGAVAITRGAAAALYGVSPRDPVTMIAAACVLLVTALAAGWVPANRAARVDPSTALRTDA